MKITANEALNVLGQELEELYAENWKDKGTIQSLQEEVRILREEKEELEVDRDFLNDRLAHTNKNYSYTIMQMYLAYVAAFVNIAWTAWCLSSN